MKTPCDARRKHKLPKNLGSGQHLVRKNVGKWSTKRICYSLIKNKEGATTFSFQQKTGCGGKKENQIHRKPIPCFPTKFLDGWAEPSDTWRETVSPSSSQRILCGNRQKPPRSATDSRTKPPKKKLMSNKKLVSSEKFGKLS